MFPWESMLPLWGCRSTLSPLWNATDAGILISDVIMLYHTPNRPDLAGPAGWGVGGGVEVGVCWGRGGGGGCMLFLGFLH